ncbi:MAG: cytochrome b/b6 domain-containing protein [Mariprofundaceae bacterium]
MHYDRITRLIHWGFALLIPIQLFTEEWMKRPKPGRIRDDIQILFFDMHEWVGYAAFALILARILWGLAGRAEGGWMRLLPWLTTAGLRGIAHEIRHDVPLWLRGKLPSDNEDTHLAGMIHGLGLLLTLGLAVTGVIMGLGMENSGRMTGFVHDMKEAHEVLGDLLWIFILAHVGMALLHQLVGHRALQKMFLLRD